MSPTHTVCVAPTMSSGETTDYIFVEIRAEEKEGSISRGSKISHALRRHHRELRRERRKKHLASHEPVRPITANRDALPLRERVSSALDLPLEPPPGGVNPRPQKDREDGRDSGLDILQLVTPTVIALGQGRLDPFNVYPTGNVCLYVHEVVDHAVNHTWPAVSPFGQLSSNPVRRAWLGCAMANPVAFYAFIFAAGLHHAYEHGWDKIPTWNYDLLLSYKTKAISLINAALQKVDVDISDALLVSILILAAHGPRVPSPGTVSPPQHPPSPLVGVQNINFYGSMRFDALHMDALRILIARRGGLQTLELYSLAETIALGEIFGASEHHFRPRFPESFSCPTSIIPAIPDPLPADFFTPLQNGIRFAALLRVLRDMCAICRALDGLEHAKPGSTLLSDVIRTRNTVQHRLLSLPHREFILVPDHAIYEACRLAALIFSDMVIFPLPAAKNMGTRLGGMLRQTLERLPAPAAAPVPHQNTGWETDHAPVLLWIVMLGAIAGANTKSLRDWFCALLDRYAVLLGVTAWSEVHVMLQKHLWFDPVCDPPARKIWAEVAGRE
ncbi:hypothetical protein PV04_10732 [Phialophora macrospora]|uniref:Uncharacterized protein n=1 Tax=Phialophora macrospora TaxID=1851006 RepID=A0A0D2F6K5_9EURO|nr:hypothetical protein PV04_10732 [Phialophora macrospora]